MERFNQGSTGLAHRMVCVGGRRDALPQRSAACGIFQGDIRTDGGSRQESDPPLHSPASPTGSTPRPTEEAPSTPSPRSASDLEREANAACILYLAYAEAGGRYAPQWISAPNRGLWRSAAGALLTAIAEGIL